MLNPLQKKKIGKKIEFKIYGYFGAWIRLFNKTRQNTGNTLARAQAKPNPAFTPQGLTY